jgi:hypothetical protein
MFWKKRKDNPEDKNKADSGHTNSSKNGDENGDQKKGGLIQKLFKNGCDSDFVYYEE